MTACKSQGYTGVLLLCNNLRSKAVTSSDVLWRLRAILIDNILIFGRRQHDFLSPANRCWFSLFQRVWSDPTTGPVSVPFLSVSLICISPHIEGEKKKTSPSDWMRFSANGCPWSECNIQVIWVEIPLYFQPSCSLLSKSFGFLDSRW